jgi:hypothetical protein
MLPFIYEESFRNGFIALLFTACYLLFIYHMFIRRFSTGRNLYQKKLLEATSKKAKRDLRLGVLASVPVFGFFCHMLSFYSAWYSVGFGGESYTEKYIVKSVQQQGRWFSSYNKIKLHDSSGLNEVSFLWRIEDTPTHIGPNLSVTLVGEKTIAGKYISSVSINYIGQGSIDSGTLMSSFE